MGSEDTMNTTTETSSTTSASERPVTYADNGNAVTVTISGAAYANLRRVADAMNGVSWTENDHDPAWAVSYYVGPFLDRLADTPETCASENVTDLTSDIMLNLDTGHREGTPEDKARRDELRTAFEAAGLA